jgi:hypothetical protein
MPGWLPSAILWLETVSMKNKRVIEKVTVE